MSRSTELRKPIAYTRNVILGLVLHGWLALFFTDRVIGLGLRGQWVVMIINGLAAALSGYAATRLATRIAEKLEK